MKSAGSTNRIFLRMEKDHVETIRRLDRFYEVIHRIRYEGKAHFGKNMSEGRELLNYFKQELTEHMREEEKKLFPYLSAHIPRLEPVIYVLGTEHEDLRKCLKELGVQFKSRQMVAAARAKTAAKIYELGTYLICLLRGHMSVESRSLYQVADHVLRPGEKKQLIEKLA